MVFSLVQKKNVNIWLPVRSMKPRLYQPLIIFKFLLFLFSLLSLLSVLKKKNVHEPHSINLNLFKRNPVWNSKTTEVIERNAWLCSFPQKNLYSLNHFFTLCINCSLLSHCVFNHIQITDYRTKGQMNKGRTIFFYVPESSVLWCCCPYLKVKACVVR